MWRVEAKALVSVGSSGRERRWRWKDIVSVRLYYDPARGAPWRHVFELRSRHGPKVVLDNAHFLSRGVYEDRSASYTPFVRAALARIAAANPRARALIAETPKRFFFLTLAALVALLAAAVALIAIPTTFDRLPYAGLVKLLLILLMLPLFWRGVAGALPRGAALDAIPERALPPDPAARS